MCDSDVFASAPGVPAGAKSGLCHTLSTSADSDGTPPGRRPLARRQGTESVSRETRPLHEQGFDVG
jgi:hypothetical protein